MKAVVFDAFRGPLRLCDVADPAPPRHGVVVQVVRTGVCRSDWHAWQGHDPDVRLPHVPGHELAGEVVALGADIRSLKRGDRVTVPFVSGCGGCAPCHRGDPQVCDAQFQPGFTHWGSFAEYVALHYADDNVVRLPDAIGFDVAASLGCRFTTAYRAVLQLGVIRAGESLAIFGCGGVGLSALLIAHAVGARVLVVDVDPEKLALARRLGAEWTLNPAESEAVAESVVELTAGGADVAIDCLGSEETMRASICSLRKRGRHVQVGLLIGEGGEPRVPMARVVAHELVLYGSHGIAAASYPDVFNLIQSRGLEIESILGETVPLGGVGTQLERMTRFAGTGMVLVDPTLG